MNELTARSSAKLESTIVYEKLTVYFQYYVISAQNSYMKFRGLGRKCAIGLNENKDDVALHPIQF